MFTRRDFLKSSTLLALSPTVPGFLAQTARAAKPERDGRVLVVVQLDGGNDGINTVVPFKDDGYARHRRSLRLYPGELLKMNEEAGLHPALRPLAKLLEAGRLAVVQGVGYPNPSRSHFESMAVWHTARREPREHKDHGWLGHGLDEEAGRGRAPEGPAMVFVGGGQMPLALRGRRSVASAAARPEDFLLDPSAKRTPAPAEADNLLAFVTRMATDAQATARRMQAVLGGAEGGPAYPGTELAQQLKLAARLIKGGAGTRVYYARQPGYDTHADQLVVHLGLLDTLAGALRAFLDDLEAARAGD